MQESPRGHTLQLPLERKDSCGLQRRIGLFNLFQNDGTQRNCENWKLHTGWSKSRFTVVYEMQSLFLYYYLLIIVLFFPFE